MGLKTFGAMLKLSFTKAPENSKVTLQFTMRLCNAPKF
jgi:hypothetical protein